MTAITSPRSTPYDLTSTPRRLVVAAVALAVLGLLVLGLLAVAGPVTSSCGSGSSRVWRQGTRVVAVTPGDCP